VNFLREREGAPCCILHPDEARQRNLADGQQVRLFNERGAIGLVLRVSDEVQPGVALVPVSGPTTRQCPHRQHAVLGPLHRHRRGRDVSEHVPGRGGVGGVKLCTRVSGAQPVKLAQPVPLP